MSRWANSATSCAARWNRRSRPTRRCSAPAWRRNRASSRAGWSGSAVTDRRLIVQGLNRKFEPDGEPLSLPPERIADAKAEGAGGGWPEIGAAIMDKAAVTLKLKTTDGEKLKLMMMRGTGPLGGLGGGEDQRAGFEALGAWFAAHDQR